MPVAASTLPNAVPGPTGAEALWLEFRGRLRGFVARRVKDPGDVDDIVQRAFLQMHRHLGQIREGERIQAWLYTTARRAIADYYRSSQRRRREVPSGDSLDLAALQLDPGAPAGSDDDRNEVAACLAPVMEELAPTDREAIVLTEIQGLRLADAASRVGLSLSGMKSRTQRARQRLRQAILACCDVALDGRGTPISCAKRDPVIGPCCSKGAL